MMESVTNSSRGVKRPIEPDQDSFIGVKRKHEAIQDTSSLTEIQIINFAESRAAEIKALEEQVNNVEGGQKVQQKLPRHMRRRAMSHNIKRLPKKLRALGKKDYKNQEGVKKKTPSRFYRRRPKNLLKEYTRRQRKHIWLETHIWHAKRFHMIEKWGHKLPWKPTDKSERAAYRATSKHCLLQDMSYMCCIEVKGEEQKLLDGLAHLTNPETGPTFAAKACLQGTREGNTVLYQYNEYPYNCIGPVSFVWKPELPIESGSSELNTEGRQLKNAKTEGRQLWLWCHPACFDLVWSEILKCFDLIDKSDTVNNVVEDKQGTKESDIRQFADTSIQTDTVTEQNGLNTDWEQFTVVGTIKESLLQKKGQKVFQKDCKIKTPEERGKLKSAICDKFKSEEEVGNGEIVVKSLAGSLLRYRLTGPESNAVLVDAFQQANMVPVSNSGDNIRWWHKYYNNPAVSLGHTLQKEFWESVGLCQSPAELSPHCVLGLTVTDPRLTRPVKRTVISSSETGIDSDLSICKEKLTVDISSSPIWNSSVREEVISTKMSDHEMHKLNEEGLVPGFPVALGDDESKIPVLLVQNPGVFSPAISRGHDPAAGRGSGWDIIIPKGWGMAFWLTLVYRGARCGGIHELESSAFEQSSLLFPHDYPDSVGGKKHQLEVEFFSVEKYNRRPPSKRPNFVKFGIPSPFYCAWLPLIKSWHEKDSKNIQKGHDEYVSFITECDSYFVLRDRKLLRKLGNVLEMESLIFKDGSSKRPSQSKEKLEKLEKAVFDELRAKYRNSLVAVRADVLHRGTPAQFAHICIPKSSDFEALQADKSYGGPVEHLHKDQKKLDFKLAKRELKITTGKRKVKLKLDQTLKLFSDSEKDTQLQICDREIIGFLNSGGFSLGGGNGHGVGFCSALGILHLINTVQRDTGLLVLVRNPSSLQYRFAKLSLIY